MKNDIIAIQKKVGVAADGVIGPVTIRAIRDKLGIVTPPVWPTQAEVRQGRSIFGTPGNEAELLSLTPPYPLNYEGKKVSSIRVHRLISRHVQAALEEVLAHYGQGEIQRLGLDKYGGSYNYRACSSGNSLSMHAWGIALDFCPEHNAYSTKAPEASLSRPECAAWWDIWERHGAVSLGRECDKDWMHVQFARLK